MKRLVRVLPLISVGVGTVLFAVPRAFAAVKLDSLSLNVISDQNLLTVLGNLLSNLLGILGIIAFFYLLWAGYNYLTAGGDESKVKAARTTIVNVILGIVLIAISYALVKFVIAETGGTTNNTTTNSGGSGNTNTNGSSGNTNTNPRPRPNQNNNGGNSGTNPNTILPQTST